jgi:hypothetical protein
MLVEFCELVEQNVKADAGFSLQDFAALLTAIANEALQQLQMPTISCCTLCGTKCGPQTSHSGTSGTDKHGSGSSNTQSAVSAASEFLQWSESQAWYNLQRATWAAADVRKFMTAVWEQDAESSRGDKTACATTHWPWVLQLGEQLEAWQGALHKQGLAKQRPEEVSLEPT